MKLAFALLLSLCAAASVRAEGGRPPRPITDAEVKAGKPLYLRECSACHGERGDGAGPAAAFVDPKPRNFLQKQFKFRTTPSGDAPTTADVLRTIERGLPGSAMPAFSFLSEPERKQIAAYVLNLADLIDDGEPAPIADPGVAPPATPETVAHGKELYATQGCLHCHGALGKGDGPAAKSLADDDGHPIPVRDFTTGVFRGGSDRKDLYYRFTVGMTGTPMPSFTDGPDADRWALVDYVLTLRVPVAVKPLPQDPIKAGREIAARYSCRGCHVLDNGKGGAVGPDLRISGAKLSTDWVRAFVQAPREAGKIYPWRVWRMPHLGVTAEEAEGLGRYLAAMGHRKPGPASLPDLAAVKPAQLEEGQLFFTLKCAQCHALGKLIETPLAAQQGPDLIHVAGRVDYGFARKWILDPKKVDPTSRMTVPGLTPAQVEAVQAFVWKASLAAAPGAAVAK